MVNQKAADLGIPNRFNLNSFRFKVFSSEVGAGSREENASNNKQRDRASVLIQSKPKRLRAISAIPRETPIWPPTACRRQPSCVLAAPPRRHADRAAARARMVRAGCRPGGAGGGGPG